MMILILTGLAVLYLGLLYAAPGLDKPIAQPADETGHVNWVRNLLLGALIFLALDAAIFHSGFYGLILKPASYAGKVSNAVQREKRREASGLKEVLVIGDSQIEAGFSEEIANKTAEGRHIRFVKRTIEGTNPELWHYFLREVDPSLQRYYAIVVPLRADHRGRTGTIPDDVQTIVKMAPLLRYTDAFIVASSFYKWQNRCKGFMACILRGSAFQSDLFDLLEHPATRIRSLQYRSNFAKTWAQTIQRVQEKDVVGINYDPVTKKLDLPSSLTLHQRRSFPKKAQTLDEMYQLPGDDLNWTKRIIERYANSPTMVVCVRLPRGPLGSVIPLRELAGDDDRLYLAQRRVLLDQRDLADLETPKFFADAFHLNLEGRRKFTEQLTDELLAHFASGGVNQADRTVSARLSVQ